MLHFVQTQGNILIDRIETLKKTILSLAFRGRLGIAGKRPSGRPDGSPPQPALGHLNRIL